MTTPDSQVSGEIAGVAPPLPPQADLLKSPPEEDYDSELTDLNLPTFNDQNYKELGANASLALQSLPEALSGHKAIYSQWTASIDRILEFKSGILNGRILQNEQKIAEFKNDISVSEIQLATLRSRVEQRQTEVFGLEHSVKAEAIQILAEFAVPLRTQNATNAALSSGSAAPPASSLNKLLGNAPIDLLVSSTALPENPRLAQVLFLRDRLMRMKELRSASARWVDGFRTNGVTDSVVRAYVWSGYTLLAGAGGVLGTLLQNADLNSHYLEHLFFGIQQRLGFVGVGDSATVISGFHLLFLLATSISSLAVIMFAVFLVVAGLSYAKSRLVAGANDNESSFVTAQLRRAPAADAGPIGSGIISVILQGQKPLAQLLPGLFVFMSGLLMFLALAPSFDPRGNNREFSAIPITKSSVGFVLALAITTLAHFIVSFGVLPILRTKIEAGLPLSLLGPRTAFLLYVVVIVGLVGCLAVGMRLHKSDIPSATSTTIGSGVVASVEPTKTLPSPSGIPPSTSPASPPISWGATISWSAAALLLCFACMTLALGTTISGIFREESFHRSKCNEIEQNIVGQLESLATGWPDCNHEVGIVSTAAKPENRAFQPFRATEGPFAGDPILQGLLESGLLPPVRFSSIAKSLSELSVALSDLRLSLSRISSLEEQRKTAKDYLFSRERSTYNYQNRLARMEQQAIALKLLLAERYQRAEADFTEGFSVAEQAFRSSKPHNPDPNFQTFSAVV